MAHLLNKPVTAIEQTSVSIIGASKELTQSEVAPAPFSDAKIAEETTETEHNGTISEEADIPPASEYEGSNGYSDSGTESMLEKGYDLDNAPSKEKAGPFDGDRSLAAPQAPRAFDLFATTKKRAFDASVGPVMVSFKRSVEEMEGSSKSDSGNKDGMHSHAPTRRSR